MLSVNPSFFVQQLQQTSEGCGDSGDMDVPNLLSSLQAYMFVHGVSLFPQMWHFSCLGLGTGTFPYV